MIKSTPIASPFVGPWIDTAAQIPLETPAASLVYSVSTLHPGKELAEKEFRLKHVEVKNFVTSTAPIYSDALHDLQRINCDPRMVIPTVLTNEQIHGLHHRLLALYTRLGQAHAERMLTPWQALIHKLFPSIQFPIYLQDAQNCQQEINQQIRAYRHQIAVGSHIGPAEWILVSPRTLSYITGDPGFVCAPWTGDTSPNLITLAGNLGGMQVFVNGHAAWDTDDFVMGRRTRPQESGVYFCQYQNNLTETTNDAGGVCWNIVSSQALVHSGETAKFSYYANSFVYAKPPLWRRLLNL